MEQELEQGSEMESEAINSWRKNDDVEAGALLAENFQAPAAFAAMVALLQLPSNGPTPSANATINRRNSSQSK